MSLATPERPIRVLLLEDDRDDYLLTRDLLAEIPGGRFYLDWLTDHEPALKAICGNEYDVYLVDFRLGAKSGLEILAEARRRGCEGPIILLTGQGERETDHAALQAGAADYLEKSGLNATTLERSIRYALAQRRGELELEKLVRARTAELEAEVAVRRRAEEALREADRRKDEFLATLGHELRNPLAPIRNALEIMRMGADNPALVEQALGITERQIGHMIRLINDLLDVARISRDKLTLEPEPLTIAEVLETAAETSRPALTKASVTLAFDLPAEPLRLAGDRIRLAQVFSNLLNNAAKYTEPGGRVTVTAVRDGRWVEVRVRDTGVGIPAELLPSLFTLFTQIDRHMNRAQGGLGIGLALVKRIVELHGGSVSARSDGPDQGAEFSVRLPLATD